MKGERGTSLIETIVAVALLGIISVNFLGATAATASSRVVADEHNSARVIAESQMEGIKRQGYASSYEVDEDILAEYPGYSVSIGVDSLYNTHLQQITVTVGHQGRDVTVLESYKTRRTDDE